MSQASLISTASASPIFNFKDHEIRTIMQDGQPWFVARDVCAALALTWTGKTLSQIPGSWQRMCNLHIRRGNYEIRVISEPAVYKLAFRSNKPEADEFTNWVASDVLPAIRKTGKYEMAEKPKLTRKALGAGIPTPHQHLFDRLGLTDWEKVQMGPSIRRMAEDERELGPKTVECILLKARYLKAIEDVHRLGNALFTDLGKAEKGVTKVVHQAVNRTGTFSDPFFDTLYDDKYRLVKITGDFFDTAFRALNSRICLARMMGL